MENQNGSICWNINLFLSPRIKPSPSKSSPWNLLQAAIFIQPPIHLSQSPPKVPPKVWRQHMHQLKCLKIEWSSLGSDLRSVCLFVFMCNISSINTLHGLWSNSSQEDKLWCKQKPSELLFLFIVYVIVVWVCFVWELWVFFLSGKLQKEEIVVLHLCWFCCVNLIHIPTASPSLFLVEITGPTAKIVGVV